MTVLGCHCEVWEEGTDPRYAVGFGEARGLKEKMLGLYSFPTAALLREAARRRDGALWRSRKAYGVARAVGAILQEPPMKNKMNFFTQSGAGIRSLVLFLLFLTPLIARLPTVALAALLIYGGFTLVEFDVMVRIYRV